MMVCRLGMGRGRARRGGGEHLWFAGVHLRALPLVHDVGGTLRTTPLEVLVVGRRSETVGLRALRAAGKVRARARARAGGAANLHAPQQ